MRNRVFLARLFFAAAVTAVVAGCGTSPTARMYTLTPVCQQETPAGQGESVSVSVAPVELPDYLDRSPIVIRDGGNALKLAEFDRWGGALGENITTVLVENLSELLASDRVYAYPGLNAETPDYRIGVRILRLDSIAEDRVELKAQWLVLAGPEKHEVARGLSTYTEKWSDGNYEKLAAAVSCAVGQMSEEIARTILPAPKEALSDADPVQGRP